MEEVDARLRAELDANTPSMLAAHEAKLLGMINPSAMLALDSKIKILEANLAAQAKTTAQTLEVTGLKDRIDGLNRSLTDFEETYKAHLLVA